MCCQSEKILFFVFNFVLTSHLVLTKVANSDIAKILHRPIRSLTFPKNSNMGIFVALAVPLEHPLSSISLSYFFEANYVLPPNITSLEPWTGLKRRKRNIERATIYRVLESKFESVDLASERNFPDAVANRKEINEEIRGECTPSFILRAFRASGNYVTLLDANIHSSGYSGRECLLRAICETSEFPLQHNGLIGDIMHVIFTPSTSRYEGLPRDVIEAELVGRNGNCSKYQPQCPLGLFDLIGVLA